MHKKTHAKLFFSLACAISAVVNYSIVPDNVMVFGDLL